MSEIKWIKITTSMFDDEKIKLIRKLPESDSILLTWIQLLVQAGKANASGSIVLNESIPYSDEMLATIFDRPVQIIRLALSTFEQFGMIDIEDGIISITNWEKHQATDRLDQIREYERLRKQKRRVKQRFLPSNEGVPENVPDNYGTFHCIDTDIDIDTEKELINNNAPIERELTEIERSILNVLSQVKGYKFDFKKDVPFVQQLLIEFPDVNILEQAKSWSVAKIDKPLASKSNPRSQFRNWCNNASKWQKEKQYPQQHVASSYDKRMANDQAYLDQILGDSQ